MARKLVRWNPATGRYAEVDKVRLTREAQTLLDFIKANIDPAADKFGIWKTVVPLLKGVLNYTIKTPIPFSDLPLRYEVHEGLLPRDFDRLYAEFQLTISGIAREMSGNVDVNGVPHTYVDFED
jgi:hypothetical protein